jgi:hypothetical protein
MLEKNKKIQDLFVELFFWMTPRNPTITGCDNMEGLAFRALRIIVFGNLEIVIVSWLGRWWH